jgi:hypothetical protein
VRVRPRPRRDAVLADRLTAAARAQTLLPDGRVSDPRPAWEDRVPGVWGVTVEAGDERRNAFLRVSGDRVAVPAGMAQAARELREMQALDGGDWGGGLIYVVAAAGGATPGFPDVWLAQEAPNPAGGVRITVQMTERNVAYAVAGGSGPMPVGPPSRGGLNPPEPMAAAILEIGADYSLRWSYELSGRRLEGPYGAPADAPPSFGDHTLVAVLQEARRRAHAPRAMPLAEPRAADGLDGILAIELFALGTVYVPSAGPAPSTRPDQPVPALIATLSAADALPPGLVPIDFDGAYVDAGELIAEIPAPLVEWAAGGARYFSPRVPGVADTAAMTRAGRARMPLDGSGEWLLEVGDGDAWRPAAGVR